MSLAAAVGLLQAVLMLLTLVQAHPEFGQAVRENALQVSERAITAATTALAAAPLASTTPAIVPSSLMHDSLIAVSYKDSNGIHQIFTVSLDGSQRTQLTHSSIDSTHPRWSPDGKQIVYVTESKNGPSQIHRMQADGSGDRSLASDQPANLTPYWSPDGLSIAYTSGAPASDPGFLPKLHIWVMHADGSGKKQLTSGDFMDFAPTYSPDRNYIAFSSSRNGGLFQIWRMNSDGTNPIQLTHASTDSATGFAIEHKVPAWSPDGKYIAYWHGVEGDHLSPGTRNGTAPTTDTDWKIFHSWHIWRMNADGTNQHELTQGDDPAWSPDSSLVMSPTLPIYGTNSKPTGPGEPPGVGVTNVDGTNRHVLFTTFNDGPSGYAWQPVK